MRKEVESKNMHEAYTVKHFLILQRLFILIKEKMSFYTFFPKVS